MSFAHRRIPILSHGGTARIFVFWGQSNMQSLGTSTTYSGGVPVYPAGFTGIDPRIQVFNGESFEPFNPFVNGDIGGPNPGLWGPEAAFACAWLADHPGETVWIVKLAVGSTSLAGSGAGSSTRNWNIATAGGNSLYQTLTQGVAAAKACLIARGKRPVVEMAFQMQGEQDATNSTSAAGYQTNLANFIAQARADWGVSRYAVGQLRLQTTYAGGRPALATVRTAIEAVVAADRNVEIVYNDETSTIGDGLHLTPAEVDRMGRHFYALYSRWYAQGAYAGFTILMDLRNKRFARAFTPGDATTVKGCTLNEVLAVATTDTVRRTYVDYDGWVKNDLAANTPHFGFANGRRQLIGNGQSQNAVINSQDLTQASWVKSNTTPSIITGGGITAQSNGTANNCSSIVATAANGTCLQSITAASNTRITSAYVRRRTGSGVVQMTQDGGTTWTTIAVGSTWQRFKVPSQSALTNPTVGFRVVTSGDAIDVDLVQCEANAFATEPIITTGSMVTRVAEAITLAAGLVGEFTGSAATYVVRGSNVTADAPKFIIDENGTEYLSKNSGGRLTAVPDSLSATAGSGGFTGDFGLAGRFDANGKAICFNGGAVVTGATVPASHATCTLLGNISHSVGTYPDGGIDFIGVAPIALNDNTLQALAIASAAL